MPIFLRSVLRSKQEAVAYTLLVRTKVDVLAATFPVFGANDTALFWFLSSALTRAVTQGDFTQYLRAVSFSLFNISQVLP